MKYWVLLGETILPRGLPTASLPQTTQPGGHLDRSSQQVWLPFNPSKGLMFSDLCEASVLAYPSSFCCCAVHAGMTAPLKLSSCTLKLSLALHPTSKARSPPQPTPGGSHVLLCTVWCVCVVCGRVRREGISRAEAFCLGALFLHSAKYSLLPLCRAELQVCAQNEVGGPDATESDHSSEALAGARGQLPELHASSAEAPCLCHFPCCCCLSGWSGQGQRSWAVPPVDSGLAG